MPPIFMQFTGQNKPVQVFHLSENAIDWSEPELNERAGPHARGHKLQKYRVELPFRSFLFVVVGSILYLLFRPHGTFIKRFCQLIITQSNGLIPARSKASDLVQVEPLRFSTFTT